MGLVEKTERNWPDGSYVNMTFPWSRNAVTFPRLRLPEGAHNAALLNLCSFLTGYFEEEKKKRKKKARSLLLPESLTGSPCRRALLGRCADRIQMLLKCGRGQQRSVRASLQHWLIGVNMELGVTFLDSDPSLSLSFSVSFTLSLSPIHPSLPAVRSSSWCLCFMRPVETAWSSAGRRQRCAPRLARCLTSAEPLMNSFTVRGWISNRNLQAPRTSFQWISLSDLLWDVNYSK